MDDTVTGGDDQPPQARRESIWMDTAPGTDHEALDGRLDVDTVVVGGGIVGLTTARNLDAAGQSVALVERDRIVTGVTGHTTAKLTAQHGLVYDHLLDHFGEDHARQYARANQAAIDQVANTVERRDVDCNFRRTSAYTYVESKDGREKIKREVEAARKVGLPASFVDETPLSADVEAAVRFDDQAQFHPRNYLLALADDVAGDDSYLFEETRALDVETGDRHHVVTERGTIRADDVVVATHFPFFDHALYFARMAPKRSYVLAVRVAGDVPDGMHYRPGDPYFSVRPNPAGEESMVLVGGQNHRTGHGGSTEARYRRLEADARERFDVESVEYRWSTQDFVSVDGVPFVGQLGPQTDGVYVATGFGGWGLTNGTAAGTILADLVRGKPNPWADVFEPTRFKVGASTGDLVDHNRHAMKHFLEDHLGRRERGDVTDLSPGEAAIVRDDGEVVAAYRDEGGGLHEVSPYCTHMDCLVEWNDGEQSWDCPCHGSRFGLDGEVIDGPAVTDLKRKSDAEGDRKS